MRRRQVGAWLSSAVIGGVGVVEGVVFAAQGQPWLAAVTCAVLLPVAWLLSPAAFPRPTPRRELDGPGSTHDGNETVPTVVIEGTSHTNPEVALVRRVLQGA